MTAIRQKEEAAAAIYSGNSDKFICAKNKYIPEMFKKHYNMCYYDNFFAIWIHEHEIISRERKRKGKEKSLTKSFSKLNQVEILDNKNVVKMAFVMDPPFPGVVQKCG